MTTDEMFRNHLAMETDRAHRELQSLAEVVADQMNRLAQGLDREDPCLVNELGELQGLGPALDVACGRYTRARRLLEDYDKFHAEEAVA